MIIGRGNPENTALNSLVCEHSYTITDHHFHLIWSGLINIVTSVVFLVKNDIIGLGYFIGLPREKFILGTGTNVA